MEATGLVPVLPSIAIVALSEEPGPPTPPASIVMDALLYWLFTVFCGDFDLEELFVVAEALPAVNIFEPTFLRVLTLFCFLASLGSSTSKRFSGTSPLFARTSRPKCTKRRSTI